MNTDPNTDLGSDAWPSDAAVREMINDALTREDLRGLDIDETEVAKRVVVQLNVLRNKLSPELSAWSRSRMAIDSTKAAHDRAVRRYTVVRRAVYGGFVVWLLLLIQSFFEVDWPWSHLRWTFIPHWDSSVVALLLIAVSSVVIAGALFAIGLLVRRREAAHSRSPEMRSAVKALTDLHERAQIETEALVRAAVNELDGPGSTMGAYLTTSEAPALVELNAVDTVSATGLRQVEDFIDRHPTSAIGVAGPRGIGKTTVLRRVSADTIDGEPRKQRIGVYVQSPVYYEAADFIRSLHEEIARSILRDVGRRYEPPELRIERRTRALRALIVLVLSVTGMALVATDIARSTLPTFTAQGLLGLTLVGTGVCYLMYSFAASVDSGRAAKYAKHPADLAQREIRRLTWSATVSNKEATSLKLLPALNSNSEQQSSYAERDRSHPDRVADLRNFLREFYQLAKIPIVIAIDELDKMASPEKAIEAINGLKDLFHLHNTHFVVSVSQDALASFALRGVPVRDVFDSSFDDVLRLHPFSADNSVNLLLGRTVKFPRVASLFCHAISGGLPRDLIRAARRTVEVRQRADEDVHVTKAFAEVVQVDLADAIDAAILKARESGEPETDLFALKTAFTGSPDLRLETLLPELLRPVGTELMLFVLTLITIREFFTDLLSHADWRQLIKSPETTNLVEELATARSLVAVSRLDCLRHLDHVRAQAHLSAIPAITEVAKPSWATWRIRVAAFLKAGGS